MTLMNNQPPTVQLFSRINITKERSNYYQENERNDSTNIEKQTLWPLFSKYYVKPPFKKFLFPLYI